MAQNNTTKAQLATSRAMNEIVAYSVDKTGIQIADNVQAHMISVGLDEQQARQAIVLAVMSGVNPLALMNSKNIVAVRRAWTMTSKFGARPGLDFYAINYGKEEDGIFDYAIVPSVGWMRHNVEEHARSMRVSVRLQMVPLMDAAAAAAAINFFRPNAVESPLNRVVKARYVVVGEPIDPDADWQYGFYLHEGVVSEYWDNKQGKKVQYNAKPDKNMLKANNPARQGVEVAQVRAERAAARSFTRSDYALSETSVEERIAAALIGGEEYVYKALEKKQRAWTADVPDVEEVEEARQQAGGDAEDATFTDAVADDDVFAEAAATTRPAVAAAQLSWKNIPPELQGFADALAADNHEGADTPLPPASYEKLLSLVASIANWSIGEQVGDARKVDVLLSAAFGIEVGAVPATKAAKTLWAEASTSNGGDVKFKSDGDGFKLIRALASQIDALAENEL